MATHNIWSHAVLKAQSSWNIGYCSEIPAVCPQSFILFDKPQVLVVIHDFVIHSWAGIVGDSEGSCGDAGYKVPWRWALNRKAEAAAVVFGLSVVHVNTWKALGSLLKKSIAVAPAKDKMRFLSVYRYSQYHSVSVKGWAPSSPFSQSRKNKRWERAQDGCGLSADVMKGMDFVWTLHTLFNGPFLRQTKATKHFTSTNMKIKIPS